MILNTKNTKGKKVEIFDVNGSTLGRWVYYYNTKTKLVKMYLTGVNTFLKKDRFIMADAATSTEKKSMKFRRKLIKIQFKLPGSWAVVDGKIIK